MGWVGFGGDRGQSDSAEGQGLAQGEDALAGGYPGFTVKSLSISAGHSSYESGVPV